MKLHSYLYPLFIFSNVEGNSKEEIFQNLIKHISKLDADCAKIEKELTNKILERERNLTTAIGNGVALPHVRMRNYDDVLIAIAFPKNPPLSLTVEDEEEQIKVVFLIITSDKKSTLMLQLLSGLTKLSRDSNLIGKLSANSSAEEIIKSIQKANIDINKRILAEDLMTTNLTPANPSDTLESIATRFSYEKGHAFPVVDDEGIFLGEITEKELIKFGMPKIIPLVSNLTLLQDEELFADYFKKGSQVEIKELYRKKVLTVNKKASIMEIAFLMVKNKFSRAYVIEGNKYLGTITRSDIVRKVLNI